MSLTPYAAARQVNAVLESVGLKTLPPQMFYNYTTAKVRQGKNPLIAIDKDGRIIESALKAWLDRYLVKKGVKVVEK